MDDTTAGRDPRRGRDPHAHRQGPSRCHLGDLRHVSRAGVEVVDIEQIVLRRRLILGVLVTIPRDWKGLRDAVEARELGMSVEIERGTGDNTARRGGRSHVKNGTPLKAAPTACPRRGGSRTAAPTSTHRADGGATRVTTCTSPGSRRTARASRSAAEAAEQGVEIAVIAGGRQRRGMELIVMDADSTLILQGEVIGRRSRRARGYPTARSPR